MLDLLRILRPLNIFLVALSQLGVIFFLQLEYQFVRADLPVITSLLLVTALVMGGGYVVNDLKDATADLINKPKKTVVTDLNKVNMWVLYITLNVFAFVQSFLFLGLSTSLVVLGTAFILFFYSHGIKQRPLFANFVISVVCVFPLILVYLHFPNVNFNLLLFYVLLSFLATFIREMVKDILDVKGDVEAGISPLITRYSKITMNTRILEISLFLTFLVGFSSFTLAQYFVGVQKVIYLSYMGLFIMVPLLFILALIWRETFEFKMISTLLKYVMFTGILSMMFF